MEKTPHLRAVHWFTSSTLKIVSPGDVAAGSWERALKSLEQNRAGKGGST